MMPSASGGFFKQGSVFRSGLDPYLQSASDIAGMDRDAAVSAAGSYTRSAGGRMLEDQSERMLRLGLSGVDPSTMGSIDRARILGGASGRSDSTERLAGVGQQGFGIYGGLNEFLQKLSGQFDRLIDRGMKVDIEGSARFLEAMADAGFSGRQASDTSAAVGNAGIGAKDQLLAPFQGLMQKAILAKALQSTDSIPDALRFIEGRSEEDGLQDLRDLVGPGEIAGLGFSAGIGSLGTDKAMQLGRGPLAAGKRRTAATQDDHSLFFARRTSGRRVRDVTQRAFRRSEFDLANEYEESQIGDRVNNGRKVINAWQRGMAGIAEDMGNVFLNFANDLMNGAGGAPTPGADRDEP